MNLQTPPAGLALDRLAEIHQRGWHKKILFIRYEDLTAYAIRENRVSAALTLWLGLVIRAALVFSISFVSFLSFNLIGCCAQLLLWATRYSRCNIWAICFTPQLGSRLF
jgi:hypothetical protein